MRSLPFLVAALASGCGLVLDLDPPDDAGSRLRDSGGIDGGIGRECTADAECDDNNVCNGVETCVNEACVGGAEITCADEIPCTDDVCDPTTGRCSNTPNDANCADDGFDCTEEVCDPLAGCFPELHHERCDDAVFCTIDACGVETGCTNVPNHARCGGVDPFCDPIADCVQETCEIDANCVGGPCVIATCVSGFCQRAPRADDTPCTDDNPCTADTRCVASECRGVESPVCAGMPCTICNPATAGCDGTLSAPDSLPCEDGSRCTTGDHCNGGQCTGMPMTCTQNLDRCTTLTCDPASGCTAVTLRTTGTCDDLSVCTTSDTCTASGICSGVPTNDGASCGSNSTCRSGACIVNAMCLADQIACPIGCCPGGVSGYCEVDGTCAGCNPDEYACRCDPGSPCRPRGTFDCACRPTLCALGGFPCSTGQQCCECATETPVCVADGAPCPCATVTR